MKKNIKLVLAFVGIVMAYIASMVFLLKYGDLYMQFYCIILEILFLIQMGKEKDE